MYASAAFSNSLLLDTRHSPGKSMVSILIYQKCITRTRSARVRGCQSSTPPPERGVAQKTRSFATYRKGSASAFNSPPKARDPVTCYTQISRQYGEGRQESGNNRKILSSLFELPASFRAKKTYLKFANIGKKFSPAVSSAVASLNVPA